MSSCSLVGTSMSEEPAAYVLNLIDVREMGWEFVKLDWTASEYKEM
jgi:hypothetical protein